MKRINVYLDDDLWVSFRKKCLERRVSASKALTEMLRQSLEDIPGEHEHARSQPTPVARSRARQAAKAGESA